MNDYPKSHERDVVGICTPKRKIDRNRKARTEKPKIRLRDARRVSQGLQILTSYKCNTKGHKGRKGGREGSVQKQATETCIRKTHLVRPTRRYHIHDPVVVVAAFCHGCGPPGYALDEGTVGFDWWKGLERVHVILEFKGRKTHSS